MMARESAKLIGSGCCSAGSAWMRPLPDTDWDWISSATWSRYTTATSSSRKAPLAASPSRFTSHSPTNPDEHAARRALVSCRSTAPVRSGAQPKHRASSNRTRGGCSYGSEHAPADTPLWAFPVGAPPPVRKRSPVRTPSHPQSHPRRVLLRFRARPADTPLRVFPVGAPPPVRKRSPFRTPSQPQSHPGRVLLRFRARPADTPLRVFPVGAPPPVRKRSPARTPSPPQSHPRRVLLRFRARPADTPLRVFHVGAPPPVRKRSPAKTPSQPQSHPGRVLLQPVTPGGDPAQSTIAAAQPKAISGRL